MPQSFLHLGVGPGGSVWELAPGRPAPVDTGRPVPDYLAGPVPDADGVRVLGCRRNARLLLSLHTMAVREQLGPVQVCGAATWGPPARHPGAALVAATAPQPPASCGGWHPFRSADYPAYALADLPRGHPDRPHFLRSSPAWPALSFAPDRDDEAIAVLVGLVLDPRFLVDPAAPDATARADRFLGLDPSGPVRALLSKARAGRFGSDWLYSRFFLDAWTDALVGRPPGEGVFCPTTFFRDHGVAAAFAAHVASRRGR